MTVNDIKIRENKRLGEKYYYFKHFRYNLLRLPLHDRYSAYTYSIFLCTLSSYNLPSSQKEDEKRFYEEPSVNS